MNKIYSLMLEARALSRQLAIQVAARRIGTAATNKAEVFFDPKWLCTDRPELVPILRGLLDHEVVGHNLHTDFSVGVLRKDASQIRVAAYGVMEDLRIETAAMKVYPGTGMNLSSCVQAMCQHTDIFGPEQPGPTHFTDPAAVLANFLLTNGRCLISPGQEMALRTRATAWKAEATRLFGPQAVQQCLDLCKQALTAPNSAAIWDLAGDLEKIFKDLSKSQPQQQQQPQRQKGSQSGDSGDEPSSSSTSKSTSKGKSKSKAKAKGKDEPADEDAADDTGGQDGPQPQPESKDQGSGEGDTAQDGQSDESDDSNADSQNNGQGEDDDADSGESGEAGADAQESGDQGQSSDGQGDDSGESSTSPPSASSAAGGGYNETPGPTPEQIEAAKDALLGSTKAPEVDLGDAIKKALRQAQEAIENVMQGQTEAMKIRENKPLAGDLPDDPKLTSITKNRIGRDLDTLIETMSRRWTERAYTGRRVDSRALPGMAWGNTRIFKRKHEEEAIDTAVYFLVDGSGSMASEMRGRISASRSAVSFSIIASLGDLIEAADVPFGCAMFGSAYSEVKPFDTPWRIARKQMRNTWGGSTVLAPAVTNALAEICIRPEQRKLFLLITDGEVSEMTANLVLSDIKLASRRFGVETATIMLTQSFSSAFVSTLRKNGLRADIIQDPENLGQHVMDAVKHAIVD